MHIKAESADIPVGFHFVVGTHGHNDAVMFSDSTLRQEIERNGTYPAITSTIPMVMFHALFKDIP